MLRLPRRCLAAAKRAWNWAVAHPDVVLSILRASAPGLTATRTAATRFSGPPLSFGEPQVTGNTSRLSSGASRRSPEPAIARPSWSNVAPMAYWTYVLAEQKGRCCYAKPDTRAYSSRRANALDAPSLQRLRQHARCHRLRLGLELGCRQSIAFAAHREPPAARTRSSWTRRWVICTICWDAIVSESPGLRT